MQQEAILKSFQLEDIVPAVFSGRTAFLGAGHEVICESPIDNSPLKSFKGAAAMQTEDLINMAKEGFEKWRKLPVVKRAEVLDTLALSVQSRKEELAQLISLENGKTIDDARAEVKNLIDTFVHARGLARHIGGKQIASEFTNRTNLEVWHPYGVIGLITPFNFPMSIWAWNAALAVLTGNAVIWKPAPQTPLCAVAVHKIIQSVLEKHQEVPEGVFNLVIGDLQDTALILTNSTDVPVVCATGSSIMGKQVALAVGARLGHHVLELGGSAAAIVTADADIELTLRTVFTSALSNTGQRCTALRRLMVHETIYDVFVSRLKKVYEQIPYGEIFETGFKLAPLIDKEAKDRFNQKIRSLKDQNFRLYSPSKFKTPDRGYYVRPYLCLLDEMAHQPQDETFGPLLYVQPYRNYEAAIKRMNATPFALSSGLFSHNLKEVQYFYSAEGSDAGLAMVNTNTGGLEVGLAFGGNKDSGGGRETGSDCWKNFMRRQTVVMNVDDDIPEIEGIDFNIVDER